MTTYKLTGATFILLRDTGEMLMQYRDEHAKRFPLMWCFPGGTIEEGEDSLATLVREVKEEYDITVQKEDCHFLMLQELSYGNSADIFVCNIGDQEPTLKEGKDMKFMKLGDIKKLSLGFEQEIILPELEKYLERIDAKLHF